MTQTQAQNVYTDTQMHTSKKTIEFRTRFSSRSRVSQPAGNRNRPEGGSRVGAISSGKIEFELIKQRIPPGMLVFKYLGVSIN